MVVNPDRSDPARPQTDQPDPVRPHLEPPDPAPPQTQPPVPRRSLGPGLRNAWVGYQRQLDAEMAAAGFADRSFPDGRVLRMCARSDETTAAQIGRGLGISRQGAGKIVAGLRERGYVTLEPSRTDAREKAVTLTPRARAFLAAHRRAAWTIEQRVHAELGDEAFDALGGLLEALGGDDQPRLRDYLRERTTLTEL